MKRALCGPFFMVWVPGDSCETHSDDAITARKRQLFCTGNLHFKKFFQRVFRAPCALSSPQPVNHGVFDALRFVPAQPRFVPPRERRAPRKEGSKFLKNLFFIIIMLQGFYGIKSQAAPSLFDRRHVPVHARGLVIHCGGFARMKNPIHRKSTGKCMIFCVVPFFISPEIMMGQV